MGIICWILLFIIHSLILKWILSWGGAKFINSFYVAKIFFSFLNTDLNEEQLRFYTLVIWVMITIWFVLGIFIPNLRFFHVLF